ncbi:antA/AntB antirepressor family protein [Clostridium botulinum]|uniref:antA/AntB antirepressor family protein n=1 Tax=Clostridium botulinum TaxID=1491 RepID=UPI001C9B9F24|nr:antA/AntB antirepressor family protein [Clostridium botulinum]MBY6838821.1 antA/AntB antirepressor family protein [Clostridium botulinum]
MKTIQRNKIKFKVFEEDELKHRLEMNKEDIETVLAYQDKFPELMIENGEGFCINARTLHKRLELQQDFSHWIKKQIETIEGELEKDYTSLKTNCTTMRPKASIEYYLTLEFAKEICMVVGVAPRTNKDTKRLSKIVRKYFILMEKTLKKL